MYCPKCGHEYYQIGYQCEQCGYQNKAYVDMWKSNISLRNKLDSEGYEAGKVFGGIATFIIWAGGFGSLSYSIYFVHLMYGPFPTILAILLAPISFIILPWVFYISIGDLTFLLFTYGSVGIGFTLRYLSAILMGKK